MQYEEDKDEILDDIEKGNEDLKKRDEHTVSGCMKLLAVLILCVIVLNIYRANVWHLYFNVTSESVDDNGIKHYVIYDPDNDVEFDYNFGKYKKPMFVDEDGHGHWYYTVHVKESNYIARELYAKKEQIIDMLDALSVSYKINVDENIQTITDFEIYLQERDDEVIDKVIDISETMSDWIRDLEPFVQASDRDCGIIKIFDSDRDYPIKTIHLSLRYY